MRDEASSCADVECVLFLAQPFLHGVKFHAMPPTKRFRDMEQLSGGEKTVAALALLFAVHSFRPSPFFVLDEVDAALDKVNVGRVARFVAAAAAGGAPGVRPFQSVVISLKDGFYDKADALVGVYRDGASGSSRTLTLDLNAYA
jgi:structural maintenance of chromosome 1